MTDDFVVRLAQTVVKLQQLIRLLDQQLACDPHYQGSNLWRAVQTVLNQETSDVPVDARQDSAT